jgi:Family of unknown function (DUF6152)
MTASPHRAAAALIALALATPAFAHHGWSDYDADKTLTLTGRVNTASYENPHATITLDAEGKRYTVVLAPVSRMESRGASRESIAVGREVTVVGYPSKTHAGEVRAERVIVKDGAADKTVELR